MKPILLFVMFGLFSVVAWATPTPSGALTVVTFDSQGEVTKQLTCDPSEATLEISPDGFDLHVYPSDCKDPLGVPVSFTNHWNIMSIAKDGVIEPYHGKPTGSINSNGLIYEYDNRSGGHIKLEIVKMNDATFTLTYEYISSNGSKQIRTGTFR